jgi:peptidoglycan hydrolase-like protein with peptidoglycan-binding domain
MKKLAFLAVLAVILPSAVFAATFNHNLSYGTTGTDVSELQQFLKDEGLYSGSITPTFGPATQSALIAFQKQENITPANGYFGPTTRADANAILDAHPEWTTPISNGNYYSNVNGNAVHSPVQSPAIPSGATAQCRDGSYSFSLHHSGACSHHGGVASWL